ncbi:MAG: hypothetical protein A2087_01755 [Spirochaetes bacterium GWD1_61_31]|nr:MAG: hypothetical protein A2Y37_10120 [Spirochaetes bacterium GWB1_60_80]OHD29061.1 MAG: hypothetical protein A2004_14520 [Spirochaetes bacterium GWC1_61_12]OHD35905.1 MAG: hypothetical protein A2087_01755 [Spirochaetes bacterium GWD1_61_31]OHD44228.1 MAG: hypothetical protein A2Y35_06725 [Spirochaetes bacterium GWE1_60_18]OHD60412.1 MAG: hypothetical protein A2Y32_00800 [Spirochaetes bacterium GWF1_60_12]HAP43270.1 hypothetical protein [Spirochaetaceae bacterium]
MYSDEKRPRPILIILLLGVVLIVLFLVFPESLAPEITMEPQWYQAFDSAASNDQLDAEDLVGFVSDRHFGYFAPDGSFAALHTRDRPVAVNDAAWVQVPAAPGESLRLRSRQGDPLAELPAGQQPFFSAGGLYAVSADSLTLHHYQPGGSLSWSYTLPSHVTAFASSPALTVVGMIDGSIEAIDPTGSQTLRFLPGGSRLSAIYGVTVSDDGQYIACLSGLEPQRMLVLGKGEGGYRVISHRYLETAFRTPSSLAILPDEPYVLYRDAGGIGVSTLDGTVLGVLPAAVDTFEVYPAHHHGIYYLFARQGEQVELISFKPPTRLLGRARLPDGVRFISVRDDVIYFSCAVGMARIQISER